MRASRAVQQMQDIVEESRARCAAGEMRGREVPVLREAQGRVAQGLIRARAATESEKAGHGCICHLNMISINTFWTPCCNTHAQPIVDPQILIHCGRPPLSSDRARPQ
jgi:hypothetical protein